MMTSMSEPRIDLHGHAGRCFLAGLPAGHQLIATMGPAAVADAVRAAQAAGMTAVNLSAVADFAVLRPDPAQGLRAHRGFRPGEVGRQNGEFITTETRDDVTAAHRRTQSLRNND